VFSQRESPEESLEFGVAFNDGLSVEIDLMDVLVETGVAGSKSEVRRLVSQGAVEADGKRVEGTGVTVRRDAVIRVGKHRFLRIVDASAP
jgi:tyrosyl-tRNA synthetase